MANVFLSVVAGSLVLHLLLANWVYHADFRLANLAPLLLAWTVIQARHGSRAVAARPALLGLVAAAVLFSAGAPDKLALAGGQFTALRLTLGASAVVLAWCWAIGHGAECATAAILSAALATLGRSPTTIADQSLKIGKGTATTLFDYLPTTASAWGIIAVVAAFLLLALGALVSLRRDPPPPDVAATDH